MRCAWAGREREYSRRPGRVMDVITRGLGREDWVSGVDMRCCWRIEEERSGFADDD